MKNRYDINRPRLRHGHKCTKYKMCLSTLMNIGIKQHLSNVWSSQFIKKISNTEAELKKSATYKESV